MFILFSPSETKQAGGTNVFETTKKNLIGGWELRKKLVTEYKRQLTDPQQRHKLTGIKDGQKIETLPIELDNALTLPAIERYTGVGYQYLDYKTLNTNAQKFVLDRVIIFSNLLGPLRASDLIPETKLKQTTKLGGILIAQHYAQHTTETLHELISDEEVLDLRANTYKAFYKPQNKAVECTFLKNGKTVSHWSKAYRGLLLRSITTQQLSSTDQIHKHLPAELTLLNKEKNTLTFDCA